MNPHDEKDFVKRALEAGSSCLSEEDLELHLSGGDKVRGPLIADHLASCPRCSAELALYRQFLTAAPTEAEMADLRAIEARLQRPAKNAEPGVSWWQRWFGWRSMVLVAASAMVMITATVQMRQSREPGLEIPTSSDTLRSDAVVLTEPLGEQAALPLQLKWQPQQGVARYEVRLMEVDRTELWKSSAAANATVANLPVDVRNKIVPRKTLLWQVTALNQRGEKIAESEMGRFRLAPGE